MVRAALIAALLGLVAAAPVSAGPSPSLPSSPAVEAPTPGASIVVNVLGDAALDEGFCTLRDAITAANTNSPSGMTPGECAAGTTGLDTITFALSGAINLAGPLPVITGDLVIDGGTFPGGDPRIIVDGVFAHRLFNVGTGTHVGLQNLDLTEGSADSGGAILNEGTLALDHVSIDSSQATADGGAIWSSGDLTVLNGLLLNNQAGSAGGAIRSTGPLTVTDTTFHINHTTSGDGGAVSTSGPATLTRATFTQNWSAARGGAIGSTGPLTLQASMLSANQAGTDGGGATMGGGGSISATVFTGNGASGSGGGLVTDGYDQVTVSGTTFDSNHANGGSGGGLVAGPGAVTIAASRFTLNTATGNGGGVAHTALGSLAVRTSTFDSNSIDGSGGGLYNSTFASVVNSTFVGNGAKSPGGGIGAGGGTSSTVVRNVTLFANSTMGNGAGLYLPDPAGVENTISVGNGAPGDDDVLSLTIVPVASIIDATGSIDPATVLDPAGLRDNGGPTPTIRLRITATNPALNQGDHGFCASDLVGSKDQRGVTRPAACDMGALEMDTTPPVAGTPAASLRSGATLAGSAVAAVIAVGGKDNAGGSGIDHWILARSVNGGAYTVVAPLLHKAFTTTLAPGTTVRFRLRAVDHDGNVSPWATGPSFVPAIVQQSSKAVSYVKSWSTAADPLASGGSARVAQVAGASASLRATGRAFAFVTTTAPTRGKVKVYVDGVYKATLDLASATTVHRVQVWSIRFATAATHTIKVVVLGTAGRPRVDLDAFLVLR